MRDGRIEELESGLKWWKEHCEALDKNWASLNDINVGAFRKVLNMPEASIPDMAAEIRRLQEREASC